ncbi:lysosomal alpha-mannosidase-like isoform X2 [Ctenocephalides felis]|uniref:lysosomal alpha-mannosidase-like isoform X2 n=1 Tax=Ctenocephalides felis TaxID=7515 RepID=UPI000E6E17F7|nr:lysosomal alpha-mannosidase-like isoform X2 [Ctenocephalides felis]XP_026462047.1 lysosomal alpha-mannosidase-like isoform X2 [Ctenocephalides felis]
MSRAPVLALCALALFASVQCRYAGDRTNRIRHATVSSEEEYQEYRHKIQKKPTCGYDSCPVPKPGMLNVHLVPHTHDDVGWLKTVDQYYYGSRNTIQKAGVQYILDSVVAELIKDPAKKFIYVESAFLMKWWREQTPEHQEKVRELIDQGRLEIIGGAWSMNDEAVTHYQSIVDQFTWGFRRLNETLGECARPRVGWQIDPFGHSREQASIFAQLGFDGMFLGRLDYQDKMRRLEQKEPEMLWHASDNLGEAGDLFTGVLYNNYGPPPGFCFDILCQDEPIIDDKRSYDYNVDRRINEFLMAVESQAKHFTTNNVVLTMGGDFTYMDAQMYFKNMDKLIRETNKRQSNGSLVNAFYSTPSCYLKSLHDADKTWTTKNDDFFPYASDPHTYWTGYFTSRPTLKWFERVGNNMLQVCKQLNALVKNEPDSLELLREAMGVMQHHDAITGTEKQHVAEDYARLLHDAVSGCAESAGDAIRKIFANATNVSSQYNKMALNMELQTCPGLNISQCSYTESEDNFVVTLYNPLARSRKQFVRLPVQAGTQDAQISYTVMDHNGATVPSQLVPVPVFVRNLPGRTAKTTAELVFAADIPAVGVASYFVHRQKSKNTGEENADYLYANLKSAEYKDADQIVLGSSTLSLTLSTSTGRIFNASFNGTELPLEQEFVYYRGASGNNEVFENRSSGAYIFRPNGTAHPFLNGKEPVKFDMVAGDLVDEVHQTWGEFVHQIVRVYKLGADAVEFDWVVGPIPDHKDPFDGREVINRFSTNLKTDGHFSTDSNGRETLHRKLNHRDTWNVSIVEKEAGNYYPITSLLRLTGMAPNSGNGVSLAVIPDRAQGGSSLADGQLELMVHRRLFRDDAFGVGEALNETAYGQGLVARGTHYVMAASTEDKTVLGRERVLAQDVLLPATVFFSSAKNFSKEQWKQTAQKYSALKKELPPSLHLLTLEPWGNGKVLLRLEHFFEQQDHPEWSLPATVDLQDLFSAFTVKSLRETTLGGNQWLSEAERFKWKTNDKRARRHGEYSNDAKTYKMEKHFVPLAGTEVTLRPMEIRTFVLEI